MFSKAVRRGFQVTRSCTRGVNTPTHGAILMTPSKTPSAKSGLNQEEIKQRVESAEPTNLQPSVYRTEDNYFDETDPLHADMQQLEPVRPEGTLVWLLGLGDNHANHGTLFHMVSTIAPSQRVAVPNPPRIPVTALEDAEERAWFDVFAERYEEHVEEDYHGIKQSMFRVHALQHEEADQLGAALAPQETDAMKRRKLGASRLVVGGFGQGGAQALFAALRYPHRLAGVVSFSGFFPHVEETVQAALQAQQAQQAEEQAGATTPQTTIPNLKTPVLVLHDKDDEAVPWASFAKPRYTKAINQPLGMSVRARIIENGHHAMTLPEMQFVATEAEAFVQKSMLKYQQEHTQSQ